MKLKLRSYNIRVDPDGILRVDPDCVPMVDLAIVPRVAFSFWTLPDTHYGALDLAEIVPIQAA